MTTLTLIMLLALEVFFLVRAIITRNSLTEEIALIRLAQPLLFLLLVLAGLYKRSFLLVPFAALLLVQAVAAAITLIRKKTHPYKLRRNIIRFLRNSMILFLVFIPLLLFPPYQAPRVTGEHDVLTAKYSWTDESRLEPYVSDGKNRTLTVDFWYPADTEKLYPLVVFSHGAFGFSGSNHSTFMELASNGYIVASISHTYQAFFTAGSDGQVTLVDLNFLAAAADINASHDASRAEEIYNTTKEWMAIRTADENFILDSILDRSLENDAVSPFTNIDTEHIGLIGHSLGGASSAQVGRERPDIDAVIVLDGTMLGEELDFKDGEIVLNETAYPVPLLNIYAQDHYESAMEFEGENYSNFYAGKHGRDCYETVFRNTGHLNFTDLPLFSPTLAKLLGVGSVDAQNCIEEMNRLVLEFFDFYLKDQGQVAIRAEY